MAAAKRYEVAAALVVVKVPGAQGGEVYLRRGQLLPVTVVAAEIKRLLGRDLIRKSDRPEPLATGAAPDLPADEVPPPPPAPEPAANAALDTWVGYAKGLGIEVPDGADKVQVRELVEAHKAATAQQ